jgi:hypothetical protein
MARLAHDQDPPITNEVAPEHGARPGARPHVGDLAVEMRGMVTPVIGYLELISDEGGSLSRDQHLEWIDTIERRLEAIRELNDQIARTCAVLRESVDERGAGMRLAPEAPAD